MLQKRALNGQKSNTVITEASSNASEITVVISKEDFTGDICYWPPNQGSKANKAMFGSPKQASNHQEPCSYGWLQHPKHLLEKQTIANISFIKFWKFVEKHFFLHALAVPARKETLLHLLHANQEKLLLFISQLAMVLWSQYCGIWDLAEHDEGD